MVEEDEHEDRRTKGYDGPVRSFNLHIGTKQKRIKRQHIHKKYVCSQKNGNPQDWSDESQ